MPLARAVSAVRATAIFAKFHAALCRLFPLRRSYQRCKPALGPLAIPALAHPTIAEDGHGHQRFDVLEDPSAPGGYRIEGTLRIPIAINTEERRSSRTRPATPQSVGSGGGI